MTNTETDSKQRFEINHQAVEKYNQYFAYLLNHNTYELMLLNGQVYYTFSNMPFSKWHEAIAGSQGFIQATEYLDRLKIEQLNVMTIKTVQDVSAVVREQYKKQQEVIMTSYELVAKIIQHRDKRIVKDALRIVEKSRQNTESKRRYWRVLNENYYGLDIHPLMEYEVDELQRILYACEHYQDNPNYSILSWVLGATLVVASTAVVTHTLMTVLK